jgi:hypothetical protein
LTISDLAGTVVYSSNAYTTNQGIYLGSALKSGTYVVKAVYSEKVTTFRLMKN